MSEQSTAYLGAEIFDGAERHRGRALVVQGAEVAGIVPLAEVPRDARRVELNGGTLAPGYVDLQVNGGGGVMFNAEPTPEALAAIARAHASLGATAILPTLITDTPAVTEAAIAAAVSAVVAGTPGIAGLHLEGPHLAHSRKGAHDPALIRPMQEADLERLLAVRERLPVLMVTIAPESVTEAQMRAMAEADILVSLGHTDCGYADVRQAAASGVRAVTHLFNAMSQLGGREPGLVGGALRSGELSAGLIADFVHVHPEAIRTALAAKEPPGRIFLVSDAMATAGSEIEAFELNGRTIRRAEGRLTLEDGTLAGADLELTTAVRNLAGICVPLDEALAMATSVPAGLIGAGTRLGHIAPGRRADFIHLDDPIALRGVWMGGERVP